MRKLLLAWIAIAVVLGVFAPPECPAPLIWRKGEGWSYDRSGAATATNPREQLAQGKKFQEKKDYGNAIAAYRRLLKRWPTSLSAPEAQFGLAECQLATEHMFVAFKEYQKLIEKYPGSEHFDQALQRQFEIGNMFFAGDKDKVWGVKLFPSLDKAVEIYEQVVKNGPYTKVAPQAQMRIGLTREKQKQYLEAVRAYEKLLERYPKDPVAEAAQFQIGYAYMQEAGRSEYDQNAANQAIGSFGEFGIRYPKSERSALADEYRVSLSEEQARGLFRIGNFYEKRKSYRAAAIYYNEVIAQNPKSDWATVAKYKLAKIAPEPDSPVSTTQP